MFICHWFISSLFFLGSSKYKGNRGVKESTPTPSLPSQSGSSPCPSPNQDKTLPMSPKKEPESAVQVTEPDTSSPSLTTGNQIFHSINVIGRCISYDTYVILVNVASMNQTKNVEKSSMWQQSNKTS